MKFIGQSVARVDALAKVRGEAVFASDMVLENQAAGPPAACHC